MVQIAAVSPAVKTLIKWSLALTDLQRCLATNVCSWQRMREYFELGLSVCEQGHVQQRTGRIGWTIGSDCRQAIHYVVYSVSPAGNRCHFVLLHKDESCPTADLSNIRPSQWSGVFDW